jgi:hypothetical protein
MARKKSGPAAVQTQVPGTERHSIEKIDEAAVEYVTHRDARMAAAELEKAAKKRLHAQVEAHKDELTKRENGEVVYRFEPADGSTLEVLLKPVNVKLTVRKVDPESMPGSSGDEEKPTED